MKIEAYIVPVFLIIIVGYSLIKKTPVYATFTEGVGKSLGFVVRLFPLLVTILLVAELFEASGLATLLSKALKPAFELLGIPPEISKLVILKPFSGTGSLALLTEIYENYGADSYIARVGSVVYSATETVFYIASIYFANIKINLTKPIIVSLAANFFSVVLASLVCRFL